jgi:hypothetical protein
MPRHLIYRSVSLLLCLSFALVGLVFLFFPDEVVRFFNGLSSAPGMESFPPGGTGFYLILAVGYMYLVAVLAYLMYRHPLNRFFPLLLIHGKLFTAILSLCLFVAHGHHLIYIANAVVDGLIAIVLIPVYIHRRKASA